MRPTPPATSCPTIRFPGRLRLFAAFKNHLSYLPHSGSVISELGDKVSQYKTSSGALQFRIYRPLPKTLVRKLISVRKKQALGR